MRCKFCSKIPIRQDQKGETKKGLVTEGEGGIGGDEGGESARDEGVDCCLREVVFG